jgi:hypothetical protein
MSVTDADIARVNVLARERGIGADVHSMVLWTTIAGAIESIEAIAGPKANIDVVLPEVRTDIVRTLRRVDTIMEVSERRLLTDSLAATLADGADYRLLDDTKLLRIGGAAYWGEQVVISYDAVVDQAVRDRVALDLTKLDLAFRTYARGQVGEGLSTMDDYAERRRALLDQVTDGRVLAL